MDDSSLKILIVEDDLSFALDLEMLLEELGYYVAGRVDNSAAALQLIKKENPDLIIMDICLKGVMSGLELASSIKHLSIPILFITSKLDESSYTEAHKSNMIGYLTKPIGKFSLKSSVILAIKNTHLSLKEKEGKEVLNTQDHIITKNCFYFKQKGIYKKVLTRDIIYAMSHRNYCEIYTQNKNVFVARIPIGKLKELLPMQFIAVHRRFIINLHEVDSYSPKTGILKIGNHEIPVSKSKKKQLMDGMNIIS